LGGRVEADYYNQISSISTTFEFDRQLDKRHNEDGKLHDGIAPHRRRRPLPGRSELRCRFDN
jgi:hypothetical protein